jgi:hypothetical protein
MLDRMAESLAENLSSRGIKVLRISSETPDCDPNLWITDSIHIQVGLEYVEVVREKSPDEFVFLSTDGTITSILSTLKKALSE